MKINYENEKLIGCILEYCGRRTGLHIIVTRCCVCLDLIGVKLGEGVVNGISDTYCHDCAVKVSKSLKSLKNDHGNSAIWPLIGCLLAGGLLAFEYVYAIIKCLE
jgi:hypothetical protein